MQRSSTTTGRGHWRALALMAACAAAAAVLGACGDDEDYANRPRPPAPITVTAAITGRGVDVSPAKFGAGPVVLIVSNQTEESLKLTLETEDVASGPGITASTDPIDPAGTSQIKADLREGSYTLAADGDGIRPASLDVGEPRPSAQNDLLQP
jgi:hypothetical protein